jgi:hypothetical protein
MSPLDHGGQHGCDTPVLLSSVQPITPDCLPIFGCRQENCAQESAEHYLLRVPEVGDNSVMSEPPTRKRRWFQFSLRTLLILMTVTALAQPSLNWAWDATRPRCRCSDLLKPINLRLARR